jgi:hypothetical protein
MKHLVLFEAFNRPYIDRRAMASRKPVEIGYLKQPVEIRIEIEKTPHAADRQWRHGVSDMIPDDDLIETVELAIEELTIALMQDQFDIYQNEDNYPTRGVKAGEPNRFVIRNKTNNLNVVCILEPGDYEFKLTVITIMTKEEFKTNPGQYVLEVQS